MASTDATDGPRDAPSPPPRPTCPSCGSPHTQPFAHAGPAARVNMQCIDCGALFKHKRAEPEGGR